MSGKKLAIVTSHPIQYNAPLFRLLAEHKIITIRVFYTWGESVLNNKFDPGFKKTIQWDIPLLEGYDHEFLDNESTDKGTHHFKGIINPDIIRRIDAFDPDAILVFGWSFHSHLKVLRHYNKRKPVFFRGDSTLLDKSAFIKKITRLLFLRWVYRHIDYALYVGSNNYEYFKKMGLRNAQLIYAPHAIDNEWFSAQATGNAGRALDIRETMGIGSQDIVFLFAGKLEGKKDVKTLLRAFRDSPDLYLKSHLIIVGNGKLEHKLKDEFLKIDTIHFMDFQNQSQMPIIYKVADVFVLPSKGPGETWGLAINEAMACGLPVLVSDKCGCARDLVENGKNGYSFEAGNVEDLSSKLKALIEAGKKGLKAMGEYSVNKIADFSLDKFCEAIEYLLLNKI